MTTNEALAARLKAWRVEQGEGGRPLSIEQAAVRIGVSGSTLKRWERGGVRIGRAFVAALERAGVLVGSEGL